MPQNADADGNAVDHAISEAVLGAHSRAGTGPFAGTPNAAHVPSAAMAFLVAHPAAGRREVERRAHGFALPAPGATAELEANFEADVFFAVRGAYPSPQPKAESTPCGCGRPKPSACPEPDPSAEPWPNGVPSGAAHATAELKPYLGAAAADGFCRRGRDADDDRCVAHRRHTCCPLRRRGSDRGRRFRERLLEL